jgi:integrase
MASVRKRKLPSGLVRWQASYVDGHGSRRAKLFGRKSDAEAWLTETSHDLKRGLHTPGSLSPLVKEAAALWIKRSREKDLEESTIRGYE